MPTIQLSLIPYRPFTGIVYFLTYISVDESVEMLYSHLHTCIELYVPTKTIHHPAYPSWFSRDLVTTIKTKKLIHYRYPLISCNLPSDYLVFCNPRAKCKKLSESCWTDRIKIRESNMSSNIKIFWFF